MSRPNLISIALAMYLVGFVAILGAWLHVIGEQGQLIGWYVSTAGWVILHFSKPPMRSKEASLTELDELLAKRIITDDEYATSRVAILSQR